MINLLRLSVLTCSSCDERVGPKDIVGTCDAQQCSGTCQWTTDCRYDSRSLISVLFQPCSVSHVAIFWK